VAAGVAVPTMLVASETLYVRLDDDLANGDDPIGLLFVRATLNLGMGVCGVLGSAAQIRPRTSRSRYGHWSDVSWLVLAWLQLGMVPGC
jgi:hypothetical protein